MKTYIFSFALIALFSGCNKGEEAAIHCGMSTTDKNLAQVLESGRECPECDLEIVKRAIENCQNDMGLNFVGFYNSHRSGDYEGSIGFYERIVDLADTPVEAHADAGVIYQELGLHEKALKSFDLSLAKKKDMFIEYEASVELLALGRYDQAIARLEPIVETVVPVRDNPDFRIIGEDAIWDDAAMALATAYLAKGNPNLAEQMYRKILSVYPEDVAAAQGIEELEAAATKPGRTMPPATP